MSDRLMHDWVSMCYGQSILGSGGRNFDVWLFGTRKKYRVAPFAVTTFFRVFSRSVYKL